MEKKSVYILAFFLFSNKLSSQNDTNVIKIPRQVPKEELSDISFLTEREFVLSALVAFLLLVALFVIQNIVKSRNFTDTTATRLIVATLVIFCSLFLITAGYSSQQIAPITGLFGTMIGYMLGLSGKDSNSSSKE
jgi:Trk-type K+ transport system membrane component